MVASGNDFIVADRLAGGSAGRLRKIARGICDRKYGVGADGLLALGKSKIGDIKMRIFNSDGSEAEMCGNGSRCTALYMAKKRLKIETKAGVIYSAVNGSNVKIKLTDPKDLSLDIPVRVNGRTIHVDSINTGVPHAVVFVQGLEKIDVFNLGRQIRFHKAFAPAGANVNFVEMLGNKSIRIRTYERGVEDETLACGTGSVAAALISVTRYPLPVTLIMNVHTKSGEVLKVYFEKQDEKFKEVWLEGEARIVYEGVYYV